MNLSLKSQLGFSLNYKNNWSDLKDQIFYEKHGRFAKKEDLQVVNITQDHSSLMELYSRENRVIELYNQFLQAERNTQKTCNIISKSHEQRV